MKLGIVGLPNVGKSTLFNAITNAGAQSANYPFCTIEPNVGVVAVPDKRLDVLADMYHPENIRRRSSNSWTLRAWCGARPREKAWATSFWPTSERWTRWCMWCAA